MSCQTSDVLTCAHPSVYKTMTLSTRVYSSQGSQYLERKKICPKLSAKFKFPNYTRVQFGPLPSCQNYKLHLNAGPLDRLDSNPTSLMYACVYKSPLESRVVQKLQILELQSTSQFSLQPWSRGHYKTKRIFFSRFLKTLYLSKLLDTLLLLFVDLRLFKYIYINFILCIQLDYLLSQ